MTDKALTAGKTQRLEAFARFFENYLHIGSIVIACVPIPTASLKLLPIYSQQRGYLTVYSSLFCFLVVAGMFSLRHRLARSMFRETGHWRAVAAAPFVFMLLTFVCIIGYHATLQSSLQVLRDIGTQGSTTDLLQSIDESQIPESLALSVFYIGIFVFSECAFTLLALREYLQDAMGLDESALLKEPDRPRS
jgi:hypothetical protein